MTPSPILPRIAIIGGGFSGLSTLYHLIEKATKPLSICLIEKSNMLGMAFGTQESCHPLNVRAIRMGAMAENPEDFFQWVLANEKSWRSHSEFQHLQISPSSYLPRKLYGLYLKDLLAKAQTKANQKACHLEIIRDEVIGVEKTSPTHVQLQTKKGSKIIADFLVLAIGVSGTKRLPFESSALLESPNYISNIWNPPPNSLLNDNPIKNDKNSNLVILGSGLTSIDAILSLKKNRYLGKIWVISRSGKFPHPHMEQHHVLHLDLPANGAPSSSLKLLKNIKTIWKKIQVSGNDWRDLVDSFRPYTTTLWQSLDVKEKKQFLRHLYSFWNHHRHRMPPDSQLTIDTLIREGQLIIISGKITEVVNNSDNLLEVNVRTGQTPPQIHKILANQLFNCTGHDFNLMTKKDSLIRNLITQGLIVPDELQMGLKTRIKEILEGNNSGNIFALGSLLFGERFETIAVPEIREQASSIAETIIRAAE